MDAPRIFKIVTAEQKRREKRNRWLRWTAAALGLLCLIWGVGWLCLGSASADPIATHPRSWPVDSQLAHADTTPTLVLMVNPESENAEQCLNDLYRLLNTHKTSAIVLIRESESAQPLLDAARRLPNTLVVPGSEPQAQTFQLNQSGDCLVYDPRGELQFEGNLVQDPPAERTQMEFVLAGYQRPDPPHRDGAHAALQD